MLYSGWLNFHGYQFSWRVRSTNSSTLKLAIICMNYEGKCCGHKFRSPRMCNFCSVHENWYPQKIKPYTVNARLFIYFFIQTSCTRATQSLESLPTRHLPMTFTFDLENQLGSSLHHRQHRNDSLISTMFLLSFSYFSLLTLTWDSQNQKGSSTSYDEQLCLV